MSTEGNKQTVRRIFEDYVNGGRRELLDELFAEDYAGAQSGTPAMGRDGFAAFSAALSQKRAWLITDRLGFLQQIGASPKPTSSR